MEQSRRRAGGGEFICHARGTILGDRVVPTRTPSHYQPFLGLEFEDLSIDHLESAIADVRIGSALLQFCLKASSINVVLRNVAIDDSLPDLGHRCSDVNVVSELQILTHFLLLLHARIT